MCYIVWTYSLKCVKNLLQNSYSLGKAVIVWVLLFMDFKGTIMWVDRNFKQMLNEDWFIYVFDCCTLDCNYIQIVTVKWYHVFFQWLCKEQAPQIEESIWCQPITLSFEVFVFTSKISPIVAACVSTPIEEAGLCQLVRSPLKTSKNLT